MPADADYNLLDVARRLEMYGMMLYPAKVGIFLFEYLLFTNHLRKGMNDRGYCSHNFQKFVKKVYITYRYKL